MCVSLCSKPALPHQRWKKWKHNSYSDEPWPKKQKLGNDGNGDGEASSAGAQSSTEVYHGSGGLLQAALDAVQAANAAQAQSTMQQMATLITQMGEQQQALVASMMGAQQQQTVTMVETMMAVVGRIRPLHVPPPLPADPLPAAAPAEVPAAAAEAVAANAAAVAAVAADAAFLPAPLLPLLQPNASPHLVNAPWNQPAHAAPWDGPAQAAAWTPQTAQTAPWNQPAHADPWNQPAHVDPWPQPAQAAPWTPQAAPWNPHAIPIATGWLLPQVDLPWNPQAGSLEPPPGQWADLLQGAQYMPHHGSGGGNDGDAGGGNDGDAGDAGGGTEPAGDNDGDAGGGRDSNGDTNVHMQVDTAGWTAIDAVGTGALGPFGNGTSMPELPVLELPGSPLPHPSANVFGPEDQDS